METTQFLLSELEALDKKIAETEKALKMLNRQLRDAGCKLDNLLDKRELLSSQYKKLMTEVPPEFDETFKKNINKILA